MRYGENVKALAKKYPEIDKLIEEARERVEENIELTGFQSMDGIDGIKIKKDENEYYMYGKREALLPVQKWYKGLGKLVNNAPILMMGLANGEYLKILAENTEAHLVILVYEPSIKIFIHFLEQYNIVDWLEKHTIAFWVDGIAGMTEGRLDGMISSMMRYEVLSFSRMLVLPNYTELFQDKARFFIKACHDTAEFGRVNFVTIKNFSTVFGKNLFENMTHLCDAYKTTQLVNAISIKMPGIVIAAGPSLEKNIKELKKAKGKAFLIAVDTAIRPLLKEGIVPDMFAIVDGEKPLELVEVEGARNIPLLSTINAASEVLKYHTGKKFFANEGIAVVDQILLRYESQYGTAAEGGSVATAAFSLLYKIGLTRIILVGQDLALTGNKSHADGTFSETMPILNTENCKMVEGNVEELVPTRGDFELYLNWYKDFIEGAKKRKPNFRVINATEGGAKIKGAEVMTLREAIEKECTEEFPIQENIDKLKPMFEGEDRKWVIERVLAIPSEYKTIGELAGKTYSLYKKLDVICSKTKLDDSAYLKILKKVEKNIKKLRHEILYQTISLTMQDAEYIIKNEQFLQYDSNLEEGKEMARKGMIYMSALQECAKIYEELSAEVMEEWKKTIQPRIDAN